MDRTALLAAVSGSDATASGSGRDGRPGSDEVHPMYPHNLNPESSPAEALAWHRVIPHIRTCMRLS